jgi:pyruvate kinase
MGESAHERDGCAQPASHPEQVPRQALASLTRQLDQLQDGMKALETRQAPALAGVYPHHLGSARNLLHYVSLRQQDIRPLQDELTRWGLSSLGRCEAYVLSNVGAILQILNRLRGQGASAAAVAAPCDVDAGRRLLDAHTQALFGPASPPRGVRIMVTMPSAAADDPELISDLLDAGMDCLRINCAHDDAPAWQRMIEHLRRAEQQQGRRCRIMMDLAGPKLRTGVVAAGPPVLKWRPHRDSFGRELAAARIWVCRTPDSSATGAADAVLPLQADWLLQVEPGDELHFRDARDRSRRLRVVDVTRDGFWAECDKTAYVTSETRLRLRKAGIRASQEPHDGIVTALAPSEQFLVLYKGDRLTLTDEQLIGQPARYDDRGQLLQHPRIGCTLSEVFRDLRPGERIRFDDGIIGGVIAEVHRDHVIVEITDTQGGGQRLRADKGINLPDSDLHLDALTPKDLDDLQFIARQADIVGYSFVRRPQDVRRLQDELARLGRPDLGVILKIENRQAFEGLPSLLLAALASPAVGVMIARGDLAVELGYERLAEAQEEILWMCEAAHMPVVWATQVLEQLAKEGHPSRAEITDAAMGVRAECVMLNKGPYIVQAVRTLDDILRRMRDHQAKKRPLLRRLRLADAVPDAGGDPSSPPGPGRGAATIPPAEPRDPRER